MDPFAHVNVSQIRALLLLPLLFISAGNDGAACGRACAHRRRGSNRGCGAHSVPPSFFNALAPNLPCADWRRSPCWGCGAHSVPPSFFNALAPSFALRGLAPQPLLGLLVRTAYRQASLTLWLPALPCADWRRSPCWGCGAHSVPPSFFNALAPSFALRGLAPQPQQHSVPPSFFNALAPSFALRGLAPQPLLGLRAHSVPPSFYNALAPSFALRGLAPQPLLGLRCAQRTAKLL